MPGKPTTRTQVIEHGHRFTVDLAGAYFSARLSTERQRILSQVQDNEIILDMFAGVGPFAISLAVRAGLVVASDLNPRAIELMLENICTEPGKEPPPDACRCPQAARNPAMEVRPDRDESPPCRNRILTGGIPVSRSGGTIHFYSLVSANGEHTARISELGGKVLSEREVRSYSPGQWHAVYDVQVR